MHEGQNILEAIDSNNEIGFLDPAGKTPVAAGSEEMTAIRLGDGATVFVAQNQLTEYRPGKFHFSGSFNALRGELDDRQMPGNEIQNPAGDIARTGEGGEIIIPLIAEEMTVSRKTVETGGVRVHKVVHEDVQTIDEPIIREHLDIERVAINQFVEAAPAVRYEGEVMIVPVLEEVIVTQKRLLLREEIRLTKRREEISNPQQVTLRREEINLEKIETENTNTIASGNPER